MRMTRSTYLIVVSFYWSLVAAGALALLLSMVTTLWGPRQPSATASVKQQQTWCVAQLALLHAELEHETRAALALFGSKALKIPKHHEKWQRRWRSQFEDVRHQCDNAQTLSFTFQNIDNLAQKYHAQVVDWHRVQEDLQIPMQQQLRALRDPWLWGRWQKNTEVQP